MGQWIMGIEIGSYQMKLIEVLKTKNNLVVKRFSLIKIPVGCIENGCIQNIEVIKTLLAKELKVKGYKAKKMVVVMRSSDMIIRDVKIGKMTNRMIKVALQKHTAQYLPVGKGDYQIDYKTLNEIKGGENEQSEIRAVAMPKQSVLNIMQIIKALKKELVFITIPSEALEFVFGENGYITYEQDENIMVVEIGYEATNMTIISKGKVVLTRQIDFGVVHVNQSIFKDVESSVKEAAAQEIEAHIIVEMERLLQFYKTNFSQETIKMIYLMGGGATLKGVRNYIHNVFRVPTEKISILSKIQEAPNMIFTPYKHFFINILGAINGYNEHLIHLKKQINLLPEQYVHEQKYKKWRYIIATAGLVEGLIFVMGFLVNPRVELQKQQVRLTSLQNQLAQPQYKEIKGIMDDLSTRRADLKKWEKQYNALKGTDLISGRILDGLTARVPYGVMINTLTLAKIEGGYEVEIEGNALNYEGVCQYVTTLGEVYERKNIKFTINNEEETSEELLCYTVQIRPQINDAADNLNDSKEAGVFDERGQVEYDEMFHKDE